jgi:hypothetical protein
MDVTIVAKFGSEAPEKAVMVTMICAPESQILARLHFSRGVQLWLHRYLFAGMSATHHWACMMQSGSGQCGGTVRLFGLLKQPVMSSVGRGSPHPWILDLDLT